MDGSARVGPAVVAMPVRLKDIAALERRRLARLKSDTPKRWFVGQRRQITQSSLRAARRAGPSSGTNVRLARAHGDYRPSRIHPRKPAGKRIADLRLLKSDKPIDPDKDYMVASWACASDTAEGPPIWDLLEAYVARKGTVSAAPASVVKLIEG